MNVKSESSITVACFQLLIFISTSGADCLMVCIKQDAAPGLRSVRFGSVWVFSADIIRLILYLISIANMFKYSA